MHITLKRTFVVCDMLTFVGVITANDNGMYSYRIYQLSNEHQDLTDDKIIEDCADITPDPERAEELMMEMIEYYMYS